jgi:hypothetical protein
MDMTLAEMDVFLGRYEASGKKKRNRKILIFKYSNWEESKLLAKVNRKILIFKYSTGKRRSSGKRIRKFDFQTLKLGR